VKFLRATRRVSRAPRELSAARNCTRDEGGPFEFGDQEPISSHRKLPRAKAVVVSVAETPGQDFGRHGRDGRSRGQRDPDVKPTICGSLIAAPGYRGDWKATSCQLGFTQQADERAKIVIGKFSDMVWGDFEHGTSDEPLARLF